MDADQAWMGDLDEGDEPAEEFEYWEDDELTAEELTRWFAAVPGAERVRAAGECSVVEAAGSMPDLVEAVLAASGDPAMMTDADLVRSLAAWHGVAARATGREMRATEELLRRRRPRVWDRRAERAAAAREDRASVTPGEAGEPGRVMPAVVASREAAAEIALALTATEYAASAQAELAESLSRRLPAAFCELDAGRADLYRVRLLAEATRFLSDEDAGEVDSLLAPSLGTMTSGDLRDKARKAVARVDAAAADRRRERAQRKARFALYGNEDLTATAAVERMPAHLGAAVKARVNAIARAAKAAGMGGPMPLLEAKVATGLLLGTLPVIGPPADDGPADDGPDGGGPDGGGPDGDGPDGDGPGCDAPGSGSSGGPDDPGAAGDPWGGGWPGDWCTGSDPEDAGLSGTGPQDTVGEEPGPAESGGMAWPRIPSQAGAAAPGCLGLPAWLRPKDPGRIRLLVPWRSLAGIGQEPAELTWIGPITPLQARDLAVAAAADPACAWRLIVTDEHGHAIAISTLRTRRATGPPGAPGAGLVSEVTITISRALAARLGRDSHRGGLRGGPATRLTAGSLAGLLADAIPAANLAAAEAADRMAADREHGGCAHLMEAPGYRVPGRLRRWLDARDRTCRSPVCRQPAARCDQDHTIAYHRGGRSCGCNLGGVCRSHHKVKQLPGWQLSQDARGTFTWQTPAGLTYRKEPHRYPI